MSKIAFMIVIKTDALPLFKIYVFKNLPKGLEPTLPLAFSKKRINFDILSISYFLKLSFAA